MHLCIACARCIRVWRPLSATSCAPYVPIAISASPRRHSTLVHSAMYACARLCTCTYVPTSRLRLVGIVLSWHNAVYACACLHISCTYLPPSRLRFVGIVLSWHRAVYACARPHMYIPTAIFARLRLVGIVPLCTVLGMHVHVCTCTYLPPFRLRLVGIALSRTVLCMHVCTCTYLLPPPLAFAS